MNTTQEQLKISLSEQLNELLKSKANKLGLPVTQLVKFLIVKEVENEEYPTFKMSSRTEKRAKEAMEQIEEAEEIEDVAKYFKNL
jgi:antitoxin component of RelBE/YafQ-DinJ toxin-antitoxin module